MAVAIDRVWLPRLDDASAALEASRRLDADRPDLDAEMDRQLKALGPHPTPDQVQQVIAARRQADEPTWKVFRMIAQRRDEQDQSDRLPFGDRAVKLDRAYRVKRAELLKTIGDKSPEYVSFMKGFVSWYNVASRTDRMCEREGCWKVFALTEKTDRERFCTKQCGNRTRDKRRGRDGRSRLLQRADAMTKALKRHRDRCMRSGGGCDPFTLCDVALGMTDKYVSVTATLGQSWAIDNARAPDPED